MILSLIQLTVEELEGINLNNMLDIKNCNRLEEFITHFKGSDLVTDDDHIDAYYRDTNRSRWIKDENGYWTFDICVY